MTRLREVIRASGKPQYQIAAQAGIDPSHLSRLASGEIKGPSLRTLRRIADALEVDVRDLIDDAA